MMKQKLLLLLLTTGIVALTALDTGAATVLNHSIQMDRNIWTSNRSWYSGRWFFEDKNYRPAGDTNNPFAEPAKYENDGMREGFAGAAGGKRPVVQARFNGYGGSDSNDSLSSRATLSYKVQLNRQGDSSWWNPLVTYPFFEIPMYISASGHIKVTKGNGAGSAGASISGSINSDEMIIFPNDPHYNYPSLMPSPQFFRPSLTAKENGTDESRFSWEIPMVMILDITNPDSRNLATISLSASANGWGSGYSAEAYMDPSFWIDPEATFTIDGNEYYFAEEFELNFSKGASTVPIPGAIWLLGSGMIGLMCIKKTKKREIVDA